MSTLSDRLIAAGQPEIAREVEIMEAQLDAAVGTANYWQGQAHHWAGRASESTGSLYTYENGAKVHASNATAEELADAPDWDD